MTQNKRRNVTWIALVAIGAALGAFMLSRVLNLAGAAAVGGVAGSLVAMVALRMQGAKPPAAADDNAPRVRTPSTRSDAQVLNQVNLRIRRQAIAPDLIARIEQLIDRLSALLPTLGGEYAGFELTWQIQRIANTYLPKLVDAYAALTDAHRAERRAEFEQSLGELEDAVARTVKVVDEKNTAEFSNVSAFLKLRFS
jgi:hypothetical protein